jgi:hypothetical protein
MDRLFAVQHAAAVLCGSCQRPVDLWSPPGFSLGREGGSLPNLAHARCTACLLLTFPEEEREVLAQAYEYQRETVREAGIPPWVTTYLLMNEGQPGSWSDGLWAITYAVDIPGWDVSSPLRKDLTIMPFGPIQRPISFVIFAATVRHSDVSWAYLKIIWPFHDLSLPERFEVVNGLDPEVPDAHLTKLMRGRRFLRETWHPGRGMGTGRYARGEEGFFLDDVDRVLTTCERDGVKIINAQMLADKLGIGRTQLFTMFKRVPASRERFHRHQQRSPGH